MAGVGGDDKVGVWAALECISKFDNIKAAFFIQKNKVVGSVLHQQISLMMLHTYCKQIEEVTKILLQKLWHNLMSKKFKSR